mmetsp:Transcript_69790/g.140459  ORF Transcript_69790/g.140459 Transcript_69790/m.140459 type:complete len:326 (-) Transcript_69790:3558-4535(-)
MQLHVQQLLKRDRVQPLLDLLALFRQPPQHGQHFLPVADADGGLGELLNHGEHDLELVDLLVGLNEPGVVAHFFGLPLAAPRVALHRGHHVVHHGQDLRPRQLLPRFDGRRHVRVHAEQVLALRELLVRDADFGKHGHGEFEQSLAPRVQLLLALPDVEPFSKPPQPVDGLVRVYVSLRSFPEPLVPEPLHVELELGHVFQQAPLEPALHVRHVLAALLRVVRQALVRPVQHVGRVQLFRSHGALRQEAHQKLKRLLQPADGDQVRGLGLPDLAQVVHHVLQAQKVPHGPVQLLLHPRNVLQQLPHLVAHAFVEFGRVLELPLVG